MAEDLQRASVWKRVSAFLFDGILLSIAAVLIAWGISALTGYNAWQQKLMDRYEVFSTEYGVDFGATRAEYDAMAEADRQRMDEAWRAVSADAEASKAYRMILSLSVVIVSLSILAAFLILELAVPLRLGNGMTLGKKIFGLGVMTTEGIRLNAAGLFIRTVLGKYTVETMIPVLLLIMMYWGTVGVIGPGIILVLLVGQAAALLFTRSDGLRLIHDLMGGTVVVDYQSQRIFDTRDEKIEYRKKLAAERAERQKY